MTAFYSLPHLQGRLFNTPLLIEEEKLQVIQEVFEKKLSGEDVSVKMYSDYDDEPAHKKHIIKTANHIAVVPVVGTLFSRGGTNASSGATTYKRLRSDIENLSMEKTITHIVLDIDSSGGESDGCFSFCDFLYDLRQKVNLIAVINERACSAAYAVASSCTKIVTTELGLGGSIGVICAHKDISEMNKKRGVAITTVFAGKNKNKFSPFEPLSENDKNALQVSVNRVYNRFVELVARNRNMSTEIVQSTEANVYTGKDLVDNGLADTVGSLEQVLSLLSTRNLSGVSMSENNSPKQDSKDNTELETPVKSIEHIDKSIEVLNLCKMSNRLDLLPKFIEEQLTVDQVKKNLLELQSKPSQELQTSKTTTNTHVEISADDNPLLMEASKIRDSMLAKAKQDNFDLRGKQ